MTRFGGDASEGDDPKPITNGGGQACSVLLLGVFFCFPLLSAVRMVRPSIMVPPFYIPLHGHNRDEVFGALYARCYGTAQGLSSRFRITLLFRHEVRTLHLNLQRLYSLLLHTTLFV